MAGVWGGFATDCWFYRGDRSGTILLLKIWGCTGSSICGGEISDGGFFAELGHRRRDPFLHQCLIDGSYQSVDRRPWKRSKWQRFAYWGVVLDQNRKDHPWKG